ncbi:Set1 complex component swd2 [Wickerhamiella sorbophila]|uniref:Set1 complex component swd2 n=1 Tax=Wickerhamiella sorbophila TaxID=45607 RepID=A0A2T0FBL9_9ASCO|nr:Set1 complex component swd2 [Wickerhamiella sorbophila]PRT52402.1 Set1 complex component swd2 [Wickerhamiella sorbophila]
MVRRELPLTSDVVYSFQPAKDLRNHEDTAVVTSVDIDDSGHWCITAGTDEAIQLYDCNAGKHTKTVASKKYGAHLAKFTHSPTNCVYASTKEDDTIRYLSLHDNQYVRYFRGHKNKVTGLEISPTSDVMLSTALDRSVRIWDLRSQHCQGLLTVPTPCQVAFDATGLVFAVASQELRTVAFYDVRSFDKEPFVSFRAEVDGNWHKVEFSNNSKHLVVAGDTGFHGVFDGFNGNHVTNVTGFRSLQRPIPSVSPVCFSMDGRFLFGGSNDPALCVWDLGDLKDEKSITPSKIIEAPQQPAILAVNPRTMLLATADSSLTFWLPSA